MPPYGVYRRRPSKSFWIKLTYISPCGVFTIVRLSKNLWLQPNNELLEGKLCNANQQDNGDMYSHWKYRGLIPWIINGITMNCRMIGFLFVRKISSVIQFFLRESDFLQLFPSSNSRNRMQVLRSMNGTYAYRYVGVFILK